MRIAYYRNSDGKITHCHSVDSIPEDQLKRRIDEYNNLHHDVAVVAEYEETSFEAYMFRKMKARVKYSLETLNELRDSLSDAQSFVYDLISQAEAEARK